MLWLARRLLGRQSWLLGVVAAVGLWAYAAYRIHSGAPGMVTVVSAIAGWLLLALSVRDARQPGRSGGHSDEGDRL